MERKSGLCKLIFNILIKGMSGVGKCDSEMGAELKSLPPCFKVQMGVFPDENYAQFMVVNNRVVKIKEQKCDLEIVFKNKRIAKKILLGRINIAKAFTQHAIVLKGNINLALILVRVMERTEDYLFPEWYTKEINRRPKKVSSIKLYMWLLFGCNKIKKENKNGK